MMILDADAGQNPDEILIDEELLSLSLTEGVGDEGVEILRAIIRDQAALIKRLQVSRKEILSRATSEASILTEDIPEDLNIYKILGIQVPSKAIQLEQDGLGLSVSNFPAPFIS